MHLPWNRAGPGEPGARVPSSQQTCWEKGSAE